MKALMGGLVLTAAFSAMANDTMYVVRLTAGPALAGRFTWRVGGEVRGPMQVTPSGEVAALVKGPKGMDLVRWSAEGKQLFRRRADVATEVLDTRLVSDGSLVVVDEKNIMKLGRDGNVLARRPVPAGCALVHDIAYKDQAMAAAAPDGAWIVNLDRLVFVGFDGKDTIVPGPIGVTCAAHGRSVGPDCTEGINPHRLVATESGDCVLAEILGHDHEISGDARDTTEQVVLSVVSRSGKVVAQRTFGKVGSHLQWFWVEDHGSKSYMPSIPSFGIVRRRYTGRSTLLIMGERRGEGIITDLREDGGACHKELRAFDLQLRDVWCRPMMHHGITVMSPGWTKGLLVMAGDYASAYDDAGKLQYLELEPSEFEGGVDTREPLPPGARWFEGGYDEQQGRYRKHFITREPERWPTNTAIGQLPNGDWVVAWHSIPSEFAVPETE